MNRRSSKRIIQAQQNIVISILYQVTAAIIGLVLPRFILKTFGSETNGMLQAINQMLGYTVVLECGIGGMVAAAFYKPLAVSDDKAISDIFNNTKKFFGKIAVIYIVFMLTFAVSSGYIIKTEFNGVYVSSMVIILGISNFFTYYFSMPQTLLLKADQKLRICQSLQIISISLNAILSIILIEMGWGIHAVKITTAVIFLITPVSLRIYVKKHYKISKAVYDEKRPFPRKQDGIAHHISYFIHKNTDIVILTIFRGVKEVSVYSVYNAVAIAVENLLGAISNGVAAMVGNIIALDEKENLNKTFEIYSFVNIILSSFLCTVMAVLIIPFVSVYTRGIGDINYIRPVFAYLLILTEWIYFIRIPYSTTISSAGHYRETKVGAIGEAAINLSVSIVLVQKWGLTGVIIGTFISTLLETFYMVWYLSVKIVFRKKSMFIKDTVINFLLGVFTVYIVKNFIALQIDNLCQLIFEAIKISIVVLPLIILINLLINRKVRCFFLNRKR